MEINITATIMGSWGKTEFLPILCQITSILTFLGVLCSPLIAVYHISKLYEQNNIITNLLAILYNFFIIHGATLIKISGISEDEEIGGEEYLLFCTGFFIIGIFFIAFLMIYIKKFHYWSMKWRIILLVIGLLSLIYFGIFCCPISPEENECLIAYYILLCWTIVCTFYMGIIVYISILKDHVNSLPFFFYISSTITLGLWNILVWICIEMEGERYSGGLLLLTLVLLATFLFHLGWSILIFLVRKKDNKVSPSLTESIDPSFGQNVSPDEGTEA